MTPFAKKVYRIVASIPIGQTRTYGWVARKAGRPKAARAIGRILKNNPFPIIIPCHRVIKSDSSLGGYAFGKRRKQILIETEREIKKCLGRRK